MSEAQKKRKYSFSSESKVLPLLPLRDIIVFPTNVVPLFVGRERSIIALEKAMAGDKYILLAAQKDASFSEPTEKDIFEVGTIAHVLQLLKLPDGTVKILVEGCQRAMIENFMDQDGYYSVEAREIKEQQKESVEHEALLREVKVSFDSYIRVNKQVPPEMLMSINQIEDPGKLADTLITYLSGLKLPERQALLEEEDVFKRLENLYQSIQAEIEIIKTEKKIRARVKKQMEKTQREYYLTEQINAIQKELGEKDDPRVEAAELEEQTKKKKMPKEAKEKLLKEIKKLKYMSPMSAEATVARNYIDTVLSLPWEEYSSDKDDINYAKEVLDRDHFGLEKVKERILEYLSVKSVTAKMKGPILCLVGPPGVGKTSLVKSIADSLDRKFVKIALGGLRDEAELRGHRKTYVGSMPGKLIMACKKAGTSNPVILLDEIDKLSADYKGDPSSVLLEILDPEQNHIFSDHYLDLEYDLSQCLFVATANSLDGMSAPLLDRTEIIKLSGYTELEKIEIAKKYLIPKQLKANGIEDPKDLTFTREALVFLARHYTREAGVRNFEREISSVVRKIVHHELMNEGKKKIESAETKGKRKPSTAEVPSHKVNFDTPVKVTPKMVKFYLGFEKFRHGSQNQEPAVGLATGLAWTPYGGDVLSIEVAILNGQGKLFITGKLGDVMQESAQAAMSYVRSRSNFLGLSKDFYQKIDIHLHVPEGATPKDGPSAGLCIATALTSALIKRPVCNNVAMTGEITLQGRSLPVGGVKEKCLAAHRANIKKILFPIDNIKDINDVPQSIQKDIEFVPVSHMDEVLIHALVWDSDKDTKGSLYKKLQETSHTDDVETSVNH